jgi:four helix bundle protein
VIRTHFENLRVYQLSESLADQIWKVVEKWRPFARDTVGKQIVRAADSIGANLAEGSGKGMLLDHRRFVRVSRGSLYETKHWLRRAYIRKLLTNSETESLKATLEELTRVLNGYVRSLNQRSSKSNVSQNSNGNAKSKSKT